ncbi:MAG TPA: SRPBCC domain-containing protein [Solirubrobacteraceae bacterium]|nr:SRPBCC domain-containing protein [Solirubrobacteraceae bacterium]
MTELIERELEVPCQPEHLWRALTDPRWLESWLADAVDLELRPGGDAHFVVDGQTRDGWVEEVRPPVPGDGPGETGCLTFWWQAQDASPSRVCIELIPAEGGTRIRVVEARPLDVLDLVGLPLPGQGHVGQHRFGPALVAG